MAKNSGIDLSGLKKEIETRKQNKSSVMTESAAPVPQQTQAAGGGNDNFLHNLLTSLQSGRPSPATNKIRMVENRAAEMKNEKPVHTNIEPAQSVAPAPQKQTSTVQMDEGQERDGEFLKDMERMRKQTLSESIQSFKQGKQPTTQPQQQQQPATTTGNPSLLSEEYIVEGVHKIVNNYLAESLAPILEETIKGTILELYAAERIKEVMQENGNLIKKIVLETIRELQSKSKKKAE